MRYDSQEILRPKIYAKNYASGRERVQGYPLRKCVFIPCYPRQHFSRITIFEKIVRFLGLNQDNGRPVTRDPFVYWFFVALIADKAQDKENSFLSPVISPALL
jgi:hypothetical protein